MNKKLSIIIPVYNEKETIDQIIEKVEKVDIGDLEKEIIIIDDGSTNGTREKLKKFEKKYLVIYHQKNRGKGAALKSGFAKASGDFIIIQDADLEYDPNDWPAMLRELDDPQVMVVYGSRNLQREKRGYFLYFLGGRFLTFLVNLLFKSQLTDINTGYKLFRTSLIKSINIESEGFEFCEEITAKILKKGIKIKEVPIHYYPRTFREGKKIGIRDGLIGIWTIIKNFF